MKVRPPSRSEDEEIDMGMLKSFQTCLGSPAWASNECFDESNKKMFHMPR